LPFVHAYHLFCIPLSRDILSYGGSLLIDDRGSILFYDLHFDSVPGLGPVFCAGLIAEIGDIRRFPNDSALAKFAGLTWRRDQSGEFEADETLITKTGNSYLRYYFVQAANSVRQFEPEYRQFYTRKFRESKTHHHRRALVLTAHKLVRMVDALLRSNQLYKPQGQRSDLAQYPSQSTFQFCYLFPVAFGSRMAFCCLL